MNLKMITNGMVCKKQMVDMDGNRNLYCLQNRYQHLLFLKIKTKHTSSHEVV